MAAALGAAAGAVMVSICDWQTLIAGLGGGLIGGGLTVVAGFLAYRGALRAADQQVAAVKSQIAALQAEREETDERRRSVVKWAVRAEGQWLGITAAAILRALPSRPQPAARSREQLVIASSPLLRGEREDIALLDDRTRDLLEEVAETLNDYNSRITTAALPDGLHPLIDQEVLDLVDRLTRLAADLQS